MNIRNPVPILTWKMRERERERTNATTLGGYLVFKKPSLITPHSIFIIHHLKYPNFLNPIYLAHYFQFLITQIFLLFVRPIPEHLPSCRTLIPYHFYYYFFSLYPLSSLTLHFSYLCPSCFSLLSSLFSFFHGKIQQLVQW